MNLEIEKPLKINKMALIIIPIIIGIIISLNIYSNPSLIGKWVSDETGIAVKFTKDGLVKNNKDIIGNYKIDGPNTMNYTIGDKTFNMKYEINGRKMIWGLKNEQFELFKRKF